MHADALTPIEPFYDPIGEPAELIASGRAEEVVARAQALLAAGRAGILTRVALGRALTGMMRDGDVSRERAQALARMVMRENAAGVYGLVK